MHDAVSFFLAWGIIIGGLTAIAIWVAWHERPSKH